MAAIETIRTITKSWTKPGTTEERLYLARRAMVRAHQIRREAAARFGCRISDICWSQCLVMAWAEVRG